MSDEMELAEATDSGLWEEGMVKERTMEGGRGPRRSPAGGCHHRETGTCQLTFKLRFNVAEVPKVLVKLQLDFAKQVWVMERKLYKLELNLKMKKLWDKLLFVGHPK